MSGDFLHHGYIAAGNGQSVPVCVRHIRAAAMPSYPHDQAFVVKAILADVSFSC
jgi:hypothetical protein